MPWFSTMPKREEEEEEEPYPPPLSPLSLSIPIPAPLSTKPCAFGFSSVLIATVILYWLSQRVGLEILWSRVTRFVANLWLAIKLDRGIRGNVSWRDLPPELCEEIGKRVKSRLDIVHFRSVCKKWRSSLPSPTRFPLEVPPLPNSPELYHMYPFMVTEVNYYRVDKKTVVILEEVGQGGKFLPFTMYHRNGSKKSIEHPLHQLSFVSKAYRLRFLDAVLDPHTNCAIEGKWDVKVNQFANKVVVISADARDEVNPSHVWASDLSLVAHLSCGATMNGRLALLRLGGSHKNRVWDTGFCTQVFEEIGTYRGRLCTLDQSGNVYLMDYHSLRMTQVAPPLSIPSHGRPRHLFEAFGDLYLALGHGVETYKFSFQLHTWSRVVDAMELRVLAPLLMNV